MQEILRTRIGLVLVRSSVLCALAAACNVRSPHDTANGLAGTGGALDLGVPGAAGQPAGTGGAPATGSPPQLDGQPGQSGAGGQPGAVAGGSGGEGGSVSTTDPAVAGSGGHAAGPTTGCGANLLAVPDDPGMRGPWDVGVRTVTIGRLTVEMFYPAAPGTAAGAPEVTYSLAAWLPQAEQHLIPPDHAQSIGPIGGHLYRDLDIDAAHGPYPLVIFVHGTASMRIASITTTTHWASRGFIVLAADYPGLHLADTLDGTCGNAMTGETDIPGDVSAQIAAMTSASGDLAFVAGHVDVARIGLSGHSQGACLTATLTTLDNVQIVIPLTGSTQVSPGPALKSIMWIAGMEDTVIGYDSVLLGNVVCPPNPLPATSNVDGYDNSPGQPDVTKRIVGITGGGHLMPTDLCQKNSVGANAIEEASADGVCGIDTAVIIGLPALFDCGTSGFDWKAGVAAVNYVSTAALEETLLCKDRSAQFANLMMNVPLVGDFRHEP